ncbi:hypothetical protein Pmani_034811 [Petrolisthes manimaculis]|uniref:Mitochondrial ribosomal protein S36 n=1 Tax=Petrolisthes manimaculis TaxID=1843537 RepID=A0AAE1TPB0_9EUCA|nr:hypothetical protein Pmani_034811 [Petrolisthes manimaculis]
MNSVVNTAWRAVKPHIPMIKFRKGGLEELVRGTPESTTMPGGVSSGTTVNTTTTTTQVLEEWQVPLKYRRERITQEEIEYINRGGPA